MSASDEQREAARKKLTEVVPHLALAIEMVRMAESKEAQVHLAVLVKNPDGSGRVGASFEAEEFLDDLARVLGFESSKALCHAEVEEEMRNGS